MSAPRVMYVCESCWEATDIRITANGRWLCDGCFDEEQRRQPLEAREALRPFAEVADELDEEAAERGIAPDKLGSVLSYDEAARARAVLAKLEAGHD